MCTCVVAVRIYAFKAWPLSAVSPGYSYRVPSSCVSSFAIPTVIPAVRPPHSFSFSRTELWTLIVSQNLPNLIPILVILFLTGSIADIDRSIADLQNSRSLHPRTHPEYIKWFRNICNEWRARFLLSRDKQSRDKCIVHCTEAILLLPLSRTEHSRNVAPILWNLSLALLYRLRSSNSPRTSTILSSTSVTSEPLP